MTNPGVTVTIRGVAELGRPPAGWFATVAVTVAGNRVLATYYQTRDDGSIVTPGPGQLRIFDRTTLAEVTAPVTVGFLPRAVACHPLRNKAYIANYGTDSHSVSVVDLTTGSVIELPLPTAPIDVAIDVAADRVYVSGGIGPYLAVIDASSDTELDRIPLEVTPTYLSFDDAAATLYAVGSARPAIPGRNTLVVVDRQGAVQYRPLPARRQALYDVLAVPGGPLYVGSVDFGGPIQPGVLVLDPATGNQLALATPGNIRGLALDDTVDSLWAGTDGLTRLYDVTDLLTITQAASLRTGPGPASVAVDADGVAYVGDRFEGTLTAVASDVPRPQPPPPPPSFGMAVHSSRMNVFVQRPNGALETSHWFEDDGWSAFRVLGRTFPAGTPLATLSRAPGSWDVFAIDGQGQLWGMTGTDDVAGSWVTMDSGLAPGGHLTAISPIPGAALVFAMGARGIVHSYGWDGTGVTAGPLAHEGETFDPGAPIAAVSRRTAHWDLFALHPDGTVWTQWWSADSGAISAWDHGPQGGSFAPGTRLTALGRGTRSLDLFAIDGGGRVVTSFWHDEDGWSSWSPVQGGGSFHPGAAVAAHAKTSDNIDLVAVGTDGQLHTAWWNEAGWQGWTPLGGTVDRADAPVALSGRAFQELDAVWIAQGGEVQHTWWNRWQGGWSSELGFVRPVTNDSRFFFDEVKTSDPVDGNVKITLWRDGMYSVRGRMRGSGFDPYEFEVQAAVIAQDPSLGGRVALPHNKHGRVDGWEPFGDEDRVFDWVELGSSPTVATLFAYTPTNHDLHTRENHENVGVGGTLGDLVGIDVGGFAGVAGLVLAGPTAWIVGAGILIPTLIGELPFGVKDREMRQDEWDWAARVFGPSLPPRDQIHITNLRGYGNREFVSVKEPGLLNPSRRYLVHMGEQAFENPTTDTNPGWEVPGQVFMHELTHVWDAHWSGPGWMANALFEDRSPPLPSPNTNWRLLTTEEKAAIVHNWYGRYHENLLDQAALDNRYFHYIRDNIRVPNN